MTGVNGTTEVVLFRLFSDKTLDGFAAEKVDQLDDEDDDDH